VKKNLGPLNALYPMLSILVGTEVDGKPNFNAIAHVGIIDMNTLSISMGKAHYSNQGIKANRTLSINFPTPEMVVKADYVGMVSGATVDKSTVFETFTGELKGAPMIKDVPLAMECEVVDIIDMPQHDVFFVKPRNTYCEEAAMTDGKIDYTKVNPLLFDVSLKQYRRLGEAVADCWSVGSRYKGNK